MHPPRCNCGAFGLSAYTPWVLYPSKAHTPERCGPFNAIQMFQRFPHAPLLEVWWVGDEYPEKWLRRTP